MPTARSKQPVNVQALMRKYDLRIAVSEDGSPLPWQVAGDTLGRKCDCVCGIRPDGGGREEAAPDCDFCNGTGRVGMEEA